MAERDMGVRLTIWRSDARSDLARLDAAAKIMQSHVGDMRWFVKLSGGGAPDATIWCRKWRTNPDANIIEPIEALGVSLEMVVLLNRSPTTDLRTMPYRDYLKTHHWQTTRNAKLQSAGRACQVCNSTRGPLDVHHRTYVRRGAELDADLIVLCRECHEIFHKAGKLRC